MCTPTCASGLEVEKGVLLTPPGLLFSLLFLSPRTLALHSKPVFWRLLFSLFLLFDSFCFLGASRSFQVVPPVTGRSRGPSRCGFAFQDPPTVERARNEEKVIRRLIRKRD